MHDNVSLEKIIGVMYVFIELAVQTWCKIMLVYINDKLLASLFMLKLSLLLSKIFTRRRLHFMRCEYAIV